MHLKTIKIKEKNDHRISDIHRIQGVLIDNGYFADNHQCRRLWEMYSDWEWDASWVNLPATDAEIFVAVEPFFSEA